MSSLRNQTSTRVSGSEMRLSVFSSRRFFSSACSVLSHHTFMSASISPHPPPKRQKMEHPASSSKSLSIGTHNGTFHCDEALAVFLLRQTNIYRDADLKRTRDPVILDTCDIVVDVGAVYDPERNRFDHHQRGFTEVFGHGFETKLSSAGLIYKFVQRSSVF